MSKRYDEYRVCQKRKHQKSGRTQMFEGALWEICDYCNTAFRYVTELKEANLPKKED